MFFSLLYHFLNFLKSIAKIYSKEDAKYRRYLKCTWFPSHVPLWLCVHRVLTRSSIGTGLKQASSAMRGVHSYQETRCIRKLQLPSGFPARTQELTRTPCGG